MKWIGAHRGYTGMSRTQLQPSADHPITVTPTAEHVRVEIGGKLLAETDRSLTLQESNYPAVQYVPLDDVDQSLLSPSATESYCPFKGDATYYDVTVDGATTADVIWTYVAPYEAVDAIAGHVAFYPDKTTTTVGSAAAE